MSNLDDFVTQTRNDTEALIAILARVRERRRQYASRGLYGSLVDLPAISPSNEDVTGADVINALDAVDYIDRYARGEAGLPAANWIQNLDRLAR